MSKKIILLTKKEATQRIQEQINKGINLSKLGEDLIKSSPDKDRRNYDSFKNKYDLWRDITGATLLEVFKDSNYQYHFNIRKSTKKVRVLREWEPSIGYWIIMHLVPKLDHLVELKDIINDCEYREPGKPEAIRIATPIEKIAADKAETKKTGMTFWDFFEDHKKAITIIGIFLVVLIVSLLAFGLISFGYNDGFFFKVGK